jgi:lipopolysaccharide export system protein LptA
MPPIFRLRRWFAGAAIAAIVLVGGMYFYARHRAQNVLKQVPEKIGLDIQQSATGFTVSKSAQGRTLFKIEASKAIQFKQGDLVELHDVAITIYGRDSSRYDRIYGDDFEYDQQSGDVTAKGEVRIDLEANPQGLLNPDQATPRDLKNPIHLTTSGLVFNQKTGDAHTQERVDFSLPQATGSAIGVNYVAKTNTLILHSQVAIQVEPSTTVTASRGTITRNPRWIVLEHPSVQNADRQSSSDRATLFLRDDNTISHAVAQGNVLLQSAGQTNAQAHGDRLDLILSGKENSLKTATLSGNVQAETSGPQPIEATASRVIFHFSANQVLAAARAEENVRLVQHQVSPGASAALQDMELTAAAVDFILADGRRLDHAETSGPAQITIRPAASGNRQESLITAAKFIAKFDKTGQLSSLHGAPEARITSRNPGQPDRVSTSDTLDAAFQPGSGIQSIVQQDHFTYTDGERKAWAEHARYTPADQILVLNGSPRVIDNGMTTTSRTMRLNRATGDAFADGDVKSTYSDLKPQLHGALLASSSPIHVTAGSMTVHGTPAIALYTGSARLWQDANAVNAPSIEFDRNHRSMVASGSAEQKISTVLEQADKNGRSTPVAITSSRLIYQDSERRAHFEGDTVTKSADFTVAASQMDAYLEPGSQGSVERTSASVGKLDRITASGHVVITQPGRQATGDQLVYTSADEKFVLTGGPPSIFDAEHGEITGVSLTLFRHDDRVLVEGNISAPTITQTRVAR